jgi:hypothetical protein
VVTAVWVTSLLAAGLAVFDQMSHPPSEWTGADRDRGYWVSTTVAAGLFCLGVVMGAIYLVGVRSRFGRAPAADAGFRKSAGVSPGPAPQPSTPRRLVVDVDDA